jgi:hypothetical protein
VSRSGYSDDLEPLSLGRWRAQIASATRGKRGQQFFRELVAALDALPERKLTAYSLSDRTTGEVCALGALGKAKGADISALDTRDYDTLGELFNIAPQLAQEVMYNNDERHCATDEERWATVRDWAARQIIDPHQGGPK